jgi:hypothetical protein
MSTETDASSWPAETWSALGYHDWDENTTIESTLMEALGDLPGTAEAGVLYDYVDTEAVVDLLEPNSGRGATEVRFEYEGHEIRVTQDGTIAAR